MAATVMRIRDVREVEVEQLGEQIRQARLALWRVKSLEKLCQEAGVSRTFWYEIENETKKSLPVQTLRKMEKALGVDFGVRFDEDDRPLTAGGGR